jgi:DNA-binding CsgD family transcriptional regulator
MSSLAVDHEQPSSIRRFRVLGSEHAVAGSPDTVLIERDVELTLLQQAVSRLAEGQGGVVVLEAAAGLGKTVLLDFAAELAGDDGCLVRRAGPGPRDWRFRFGVMRALLESPLREAPASERVELSSGVAGRAAALLLDDRSPHDGDVMLAHSFLWLCADIAAERPLAIFVDDAHWSDHASLEVLSYLARRIDDLPVLIVLATRAEYPGPAADLVTLMGGVRTSTIMHPQPLTASGAVRLIHRLAPLTPVKICCDCQAAVEGNPWLLTELARQFAAGGLSGTAAHTATPVARNVVRRRLAELPARYRGLAAAIAVVGAELPAPVLGAVAGIAASELGLALDALAAAGLLSRDRTRFAHDLIASAIAADLTEAARERLRRDAGRALIDSGAPAELVARQLLRVVPAPERWIGELSEQERGRMLAELVSAAFEAGEPGATPRLGQALHAVPAGPGRAELLTRIAAAAALDEDHAALPEPSEHDPAAMLDVLTLTPGSQAERADRVTALERDTPDDAELRRVAAAHRAWLATEEVKAGAAACAASARDALDGDLLLDATSRRAAFHLAVRALVLADQADEAEHAIEALRALARARGSSRLEASAALYASELTLRAGRVTDAERHARRALTLGGAASAALSGAAVATLVGALAERGAFDEGHELLSARGLDGPLPHTRWAIGVRHAKARLWLAEGDFERAFAEACEAGTLDEQQGRRNPTQAGWRSTAALALSHMGRREEAALLADIELSIAFAFGAPVPIARARHARVVAEGDHVRRMTMCERALEMLESKSAVLETVRLRLELGSTLSYVGNRLEAREVLRPALAQADALGAALLAERARRELVATGLRPRRAAVDGIESLTPRQRQICELAAAGKPNRAIAQQLFLSIKTVETHLAAGYRKLGVGTRAELAAQLAV